jgi:TonB family protein
MAAREKGREPRAASLLVSVMFHALAGLGVAASSWWWGAPMQEAWKTHTVSLVDAPLSLQQPVTVSSAVLPKTPSPPKIEVKTPAPSKASPPPTAEAKMPPPSPKPEAAKPPTESKAKAPSPAKPTPAKPAPAKPTPAKPAPAKPAQDRQAATSQEVRSAIEALRQRQAKHDQEEQAEVTRQQAASARIDALRDQLEQQDTVGGAAVMAAGVQRVRLMAYQDRVRAKIIEMWILPLSAEQTRDLQATAQFQVTRNGQVAQLELVNPSGNSLYDDSLLRAIWRASPLPALPDDYPLDVLEVEMRFRSNS